MMMAKNKKLPIDVKLPIPSDFSLCSDVDPLIISPYLQKQVVRQAIAAAYSISKYKIDDDRYNKPQQLVSDDHINMITSLIQSLKPKDSVEAALAIQFVATHIHGLKELQESDYSQKSALPFLAFSQSTLDCLNRYRNKGSQQINVQYNVNKGQVVNIKKG